MLCTGGEPVSELDFVRQAVVRPQRGCAGPLAKLALTGLHLDILEEALGSQWAWAYLLHSYIDEGDRLVFGLCALHWLGLSRMVWRNAGLMGRADWKPMSQAILHAACAGCGMDPKEVSNLLVWRSLSPA